MGISRGTAKILLNELGRKRFEGRILTLGRQDIYFTQNALYKIVSGFGFDLASQKSVTHSRKPDLAEKGYISDDCFFKAIGFAECKSLDYSDYEGASYIFDLSSRGVPDHLIEAFDVIFDGGTIEHVFHIPNALENLYKMLRTGGRIIHISPSSNHIDHGFYMFSPTLFYDFYKANKFQINALQIFRYTQHFLTGPYEVSNYEPGCLKAVSMGGLDDGLYAVICIVTKTEDSTGDIVPQQGRLVHDIWCMSEPPRYQTRVGETSVLFHNLLRRTKVFAKGHPFVYFVSGRILEFGKYIRQRLGKKGLGLKVIARY